MAPKRIEPGLIKMAEMGMICGKEIEIQQHTMENDALSIYKSHQSIKLSAEETVLNEGKIGMLKAHQRVVEDDLVKAISVTTRKEAKQMTISAAKARIEQVKKIVFDQTTRKEEYAEIITHQSKALKEYEEKHQQDTKHREEIEEAISWYDKLLGFRIETGRGIKFIFTNIDIEKPKEEYFFTIRLENDTYSLLDCRPHVTDAKNLIHQLNITNGLYSFVRNMRTNFQHLSAAGSYSHPQETTIISMSAPISSVSTDNESPAMKRQAGRKLRHLQGALSSIQSPGSIRRSPRLKVKK